MTQQLHKCIIGVFDISDAFQIVDLLFESGYLSSACMEKDKKWYVEILHDSPIDNVSVKSALSCYKISNMEFSEVEDIDWLTKSFENFNPIIIGNFYVYGSHLRDRNMPTSKSCIEISAATAFGTGEHPTTNGCVRACQAYFDPKQHGCCLDLGCGSGILGIVLAKIGGRNIFAMDCDEEAVRVAKENFSINGVAHKIHATRNQYYEFAHRQYDFIVANILAEPLISMSESIAHCLNQRGLLILSGFLSDDVNVLKKYKQHGLVEKYKYNVNGWATIVFEKNTH